MPLGLARRLHGSILQRGSRLLDIAPDVLRHRLVLSYEALADALTPDQIVSQIVAKVPKPDKPLAHHPDER